MLTLAFSLLVACSSTTASSAADKLGYTSKGQPADGTAASGYDATECVDISDDVSCNDETVVVCCNADACAVATSGGFVAVCESTSDCDAAGTALGEYCAGDGGNDTGGGGGDTALRAPRPGGSVFVPFDNDESDTHESETCQ